MTSTVSTGFCLERYGSATEDRTFFISLNGAGTVTTIEPEVEHLIVQSGDPRSFFCPELGRLSGAAPVTLLGATTTIAVRLIL
jgi:hypothetical protein